MPTAKPSPPSALTRLLGEVQTLVAPVALAPLRVRLRSGDVTRATFVAQATDGGVVRWGLKLRSEWGNTWVHVLPYGRALLWVPGAWHAVDAGPGYLARHAREYLRVAGVEVLDADAPSDDPTAPDGGAGSTEAAA